MQKLVSDNLWPEIKKIASKSKRRMAAIAYVTSDKYLKFKRGDTLVVDASDAKIKAGDTSAAVLRAASKRGASLFTVPGLHAKVIVCDRTAVIGSANASESSTNLVEAAIITDDHTAAAQSVAMIDQLTEAGRCIDEKYLRRIEAIKVTKQSGGRRRLCSNACSEAT